MIRFKQVGKFMDDHIVFNPLRKIDKLGVYFYFTNGWITFTPGSGVAVCVSNGTEF